MGFPFRALPPRGAVRLSAPLPFLLFLTSRPAALRTRRSRCPAASRSCSPRGSVPLKRPKAVRGRCSLGFSFPPSEFLPDHPVAGFPAPALLRFPRSFSGRRIARHSRALPDGRTAFPLASKGNSLEVSHQSPVLAFSRGPWRSPGEPDEAVGSQYGRTTPVPWDHAVALLRRSRPERSEEQSRRPNTR